MPKLTAEQASAAAKKAWRTRRKRAKPSPAMAKILSALATTKGATLDTHGYEKLGLVGASLGGLPYYHSRMRINRTTFRCLLDRKWIALDRQFHTGGQYGTLPDGTHALVDPSYQRHYKITDKGREALKRGSPDV